MKKQPIELKTQTFDINVQRVESSEMSDRGIRHLPSEIAIIIEDDGTVGKKEPRDLVVSMTPKQAKALIKAMVKLL